MQETERTMTVIDTETQAVKVIKSKATTLGELKADLVSNGFNVTGKTVQEAKSRVELKGDDSVLPHDIPYHGEITNDLVLRLTKTNKNIASGMDRTSLYGFIKSNNLSEEVKRVFGKNFTQCSTKSLEEFVAKHSGKHSKTSPKTKAQETETTCSCDGPDLKAIVCVMAKAMKRVDIFSKSEEVILNHFFGADFENYAEKGNTDENQSFKKLNSMFSGM